MFYRVLRTRPGEGNESSLRRSLGRTKRAANRLGVGAAVRIGIVGLLVMVSMLGGHTAVSVSPTPTEPPLMLELETLVEADSCIECHKDPGFRVTDPKLYFYYTGFTQSKHYLAAVSCAECHGGDPKAGADNKAGAHVGILAPSNPWSMVHYKKVPATCGKCHEAEYKYFSSSEHFASLQNGGKGPNCVTCHGSMTSQVFYTEIVETTCESCHDGKKLDSVSNEARAILQRLKIAQAYMGWTRLYVDNSTRDWSDNLKQLERRHRRVTEAWHRFELEAMKEETVELLAELRSVFDELWKEKNATRPAGD